MDGANFGDSTLIYHLDHGLANLNLDSTYCHAPCPVTYLTIYLITQEIGFLVSYSGN
jgi:hypothetical protein